MTVVRALSDYKPVLEKLSNGIAAPYLGMMGQEVPESKRQEDASRHLHQPRHCGWADVQCRDTER